MGRPIDSSLTNKPMLFINAREGTTMMWGFFICCADRGNNIKVQIAIAKNLFILSFYFMIV